MACHPVMNMSSCRIIERQMLDWQPQSCSCRLTKRSSFFLLPLMGSRNRPTSPSECEEEEESCLASAH